MRSCKPCNALKTLLKDRMRPYHLQRVQLLIPDNYFPHFDFDHWYLQKTTANQIVPANILFTDEAIFR